MKQIQIDYIQKENFKNIIYVVPAMNNKDIKLT